MMRQQDRAEREEIENTESYHLYHMYADSQGPAVDGQHAILSPLIVSNEMMDRARPPEEMIYGYRE